MFKNRTAHIKISKDIPAGFNPTFGEFTKSTDYVTALEATEAAANRVIDHLVKGAVTIIAVQAAAKIVVRMAK